MTPKSTE